MQKLEITNDQSAVIVEGLIDVKDVESSYDGITIKLKNAEVKNIADLKVEGSARRIIWNGKVDGVQRNLVLIIDTTNGKINGGWLIFGDKENCLTYYTDLSKLRSEATGSVDDESAKINLQFVDKKSALTPRTFTFIANHSLLSLGSSFDHVTISSAEDDIYLSRSLITSSQISGVIKNKSVVKIDNGKWKFDDNKSFVVETSDSEVKIYDGGCL